MYERMAVAHETAAYCATENDLDRLGRSESDSIRRAALEEHFTGAARAWLAAASNYESSDEEYREPGYKVGSGMARPSGSGVDGGSVAYAAGKLRHYARLCSALQLPALGIDLVKPADDLYQELSRKEAQKGNDAAAQQALDNIAECKRLATELQKEAEAEDGKEWHGLHIAQLPLSALFWYDYMQPDFSRRNGR